MEPIMEEISVKQAVDAYKQGNFERALSFYKILASKHDVNIYKANIRLCEKHIFNIIRKESLNPSTITPQESDKTFLDSLIDNKPEILFPATNNKFKAYIAEAVIQANGNLTALERLQSKYHHSSKDLVDGMLEGLRLRKLIDKRPIILIAGHDLRFVQPFIEYFQQYFEVIIDQWSATNKHDPQKSIELLKKADLIWCEWCCGNAVWYSRNINQKQKLVVRLHKFEIGTTYPSQVEWSKVQAMIFIAEGMRSYANQKHQITCKQYILYNGFNVDAVENSFTGQRDRHAIALLGYVPYIKRLDRGIGYFEKAWARDKRCSFHIKGKSAEELPWVWQKEQVFFENQHERLKLLKNRGASITQEPYDDLVHHWLANKGFVLSASDIEGSHQAVAEGMACGTIPLIYGDWIDKYQARFIYPSELCFRNEDAALDYMFSLLDNPDEYEIVSKRVKEFAHENFNVKTILHGALRIVSGREEDIPYVPIPQTKHIIVFTDLCINVIDGSNVWLMSLLELLLLDKNLVVVLVSREQSRIPNQFSKFEASGRFICEVFPGQYCDNQIDSYVEHFSNVIEKYKAKKSIIRCAPNIGNRLLPILGLEKVSSLIYYLIGETYPEESFLKTTHGIFVQTEESKQCFQNRFPVWSKYKQVRILPPMIPKEFHCETILPKEKFIISYTGKISKGYMAKEMVDYISSVRNSHDFLICAAKYHRADGADYIKSIKHGLSIAAKNKKLLLFESLPREDVIELVKTSHIGWSIRSDQFESSTEVSTKVLEYCSLGKPVLLNKHNANVNLLGEDYPLFVEKIDQLDDILSSLLSNLDVYIELSERCRQASAPYRMHKIFNEVIDII